MSIFDSTFDDTFGVLEQDVDQDTPTGSTFDSTFDSTFVVPGTTHELTLELDTGASVEETHSIDSTTVLSEVNVDAEADLDIVYNIVRVGDQISPNLTAGADIEVDLQVIPGSEEHQVTADLTASSSVSINLSIQRGEEKLVPLSLNAFGGADVSLEISLIGDEVQNYSIIQLDGDISDKYKRKDLELVQADNYTIRAYVKDNAVNVTRSIADATFYIYNDFGTVMISKRMDEGDIVEEAGRLKINLTHEDTEKLIEDGRYEFRIRSGSIHKTLKKGLIDRRRTVSRFNTE